MSTQHKSLSTKLFDGYSTCFRQWRAEHSHCQYLHGYGTSFKVTFEGKLDDKNWVMDFGAFKRPSKALGGVSLKEHLNYLLDHTVIVAEDDPKMEQFRQMDREGMIQLRVLPHVGCEKFAEHLFYLVDGYCYEETKGRVRVKKVEFFENDKNSAIAIRG